MANHDLEFQETFSPSSTEIDFLTEKINEESRAQNISCDAYPFGIFVRNKKSTTSESSSNTPSAAERVVTSEENVGDIVGGCNGSIVYGSIYTDQLWVHQNYRGKGIGRMIMEKVHEMGRRKECSFASVNTMDFQRAQTFYEALGYVVEFERMGYVNGAKMIYLRKGLHQS